MAPHDPLKRLRAGVWVCGCVYVCMCNASPANLAMLNACSPSMPWQDYLKNLLKLNMVTWYCFSSFHTSYRQCAPGFEQSLYWRICNMYVCAKMAERLPSTDVIVVRSRPLIMQLQQVSKLKHSGYCYYPTGSLSALCALIKAQCAWVWICVRE